MRTPAVAFLWFALAVILLAGCGRQERPSPKDKVTIAVSRWPASAPFYIAAEKGYFADEGLDATLRSYASGHLAFTHMLAGGAEFATCADTPIALAAVRGKRFVVLATIAEIDQPIVIVARRDRGISAPDDLRGKRIGLTAGSAAEFFLHVYLTTSYIDPKGVRVVNVDTDRVVDALLNGEVDAVSTWAPYSSILRDRLGGKALTLGDPSIYTMMWNVSATPEFVKNRPDCVRKLLRALFRANSFISEHPDEALTVTAQRTDMDVRTLKETWRTYSFDTVLDQSLIVNLEDQARWMIKEEAGGAGKVPDFGSLIYTGGLGAVRPEAVRVPGR